jgi:hypothetical protein
VADSYPSLIAVMLGILRMDIDTCIKEYLEMGPKIFPVEGLISGSKISRLLKVLSDNPRFDPEPLEKAIQRLVQKYLKKDGKKASMRSEAQLQEGLSKCQVYISRSLLPLWHFIITLIYLKGVMRYSNGT